MVDEVIEGKIREGNVIDKKVIILNTNKTINNRSHKAG